MSQILCSENDNLHKLQREVAVLSEHLAASYEAISLLYAVSERLRDAGRAEQLGPFVLDWLIEVLPAEGAALCLINPNGRDGDESAMFVSQGDCRLDQRQFARLVDALEPVARSCPFVINKAAEVRRDWLHPDVHDLIVVPLSMGERTCGWLAAVNHADGGWFGTDQERMLESVATMIALHHAAQDDGPQRGSAVTTEQKTKAAGSDARRELTTNDTSDLSALQRPAHEASLEDAVIMIVDDEPINIKAVRKYLEGFGYKRFVATTDSSQALDMIRRERPDVVLLDIMMPHVNGLELLRMMRNDPGLQYLPVIILTAYCDAQTKRQALETGATDFLAKPVDPSELAPRVRNALIVKMYQDHLLNYAEQLEHEVRQRTQQLSATRQEAALRYEAGKAEIATEVLHNVGNALNSVNVSASIVRQMLEDSKLKSLRKSAELIREHGDDLATFIRDDLRGRLLPSYLIELSDSLVERHSVMLGEMESLGKHLDHIKAIVATQQKYARVAVVNEPVSLASLLADAEKLVGITHDEDGIRVERHFADVPEVHSDRQKLLQVLVNLLKNAVQSIRQHQPAGQGTLKLGISQPSTNAVTLSIADNGSGIPSENVVKIFSHGFTTKKDGHGFGLHSCANLVTELGGKLRVHSDGLGHGATFILELSIDCKE